MSTKTTIVNELKAGICTTPRTVTWTLTGTDDLSQVNDNYTDGYKIMSTIEK